MATLSGNVVLAELQKKLKVRRVSNESAENSLPPSAGGLSQIPEKPPSVAGGKSKSVSEAKKSSISTGQIQGRSKWISHGETEPDLGLPSNNPKPLPQIKSRINTRSLPKSNYLLRTANIPPPPKNPPPVLNRDERDNRINQTHSHTPSNANTSSKAVSFQSQDCRERDGVKDESSESCLESVPTPSLVDHTSAILKPHKSNTFTDGVISPPDHTPSYNGDANDKTSSSSDGVNNTEMPQWVNNNKSRRHGRVGVKTLLKMFGQQQAQSDRVDQSTAHTTPNKQTTPSNDKPAHSSPSGTNAPPLSPPGSSSETDFTSSTEDVSQTPLIRQMSISLKNNARLSVIKPAAAAASTSPATSQTRTDPPAASFSSASSMAAPLSNAVGLGKAPPTTVGGSGSGVGRAEVGTSKNDDEDSDDDISAYQNVLEENLSKVNKPLQGVKQTSTPRTRRTSIGKKPKPLPRKTSGGSAPSMSFTSSSSSDVDSPLSVGGSFSAGGEFDSGGNSSPQVLSVMIDAVAADSKDLEFEVPGKSDQSDGFGLHPLMELECEIDQLATIAKLPSLAESGSHATTSSYPAKQEVGKTKSYNPVGESNLAFRRRNTPKEQRELRNGICSDGATQFDSDTDDEYITMSSVSHMNPMMSLNPVSPLPTVTEHSLPQQPDQPPTSPSLLNLPMSNFDPRETGYYLKIIASTLQRNVPPRDPNFIDSPTTPRSDDEYIDMSGTALELENESTGMESKSLPIHLMRNNVHPEALTTTRKTSNSLSSSHNLSVQPAPARKLKYSDVTIQAVGTVPRSRTQHVATKYQKVQVGPHGATLASTPSGARSFSAVPQGNSLQQSSEVNMKCRELPPLPFRFYSNSTFKSDGNAVVATSPSGAGPNSIPVSISSVTIPGGTPGSSSNLVPIPGRGGVWHEYVEIDEEEIKRKSPKELFADSKSTTPQPQSSQPAQSSPTPQVDPYQIRRVAPEIPDRPDNLATVREGVASSEYAYAAVPGKNMLGLQWLNFTASRISPSSLMTSASLSSSSPVAGEQEPNKSIPTRVVRKQPTVVNLIGGHPSNLPPRPPTPPPKTDSLLREQRGSDSSVQPYLTPVMVKRNHKPRKSSLPVMAALSLAPKPPPVLTRRVTHGSSPTSQSTPNLAAVRSCDPRGRSCDNMRGRAVSHRRIEEEPNRANEHAKLARQRSQSISEIETTSKPDQNTSSQHSDSRAFSTSTLPNPDPPYQNLPSAVAPSDPDEPPRLQRKAARRNKTHGGAVHRKLDRRSLAIIMKNRSAIARQLSQKQGPGWIELGDQASDDNIEREASPGISDGHPQDAGETRSSQEKQTVIRSLGEILLELDALLRNNVCTEDDLVSAIEDKLNIPLSGGSVKRSVKGEEPAGGGGCGQSRDEGLNVGGNHDDGVNSELQDQPIEFTDQDVKDVVDFVSENRIDSPDNGNETSEQFFMELPEPTDTETQECEQTDSHSHYLIPESKERSNTVVILEDDDDDESNSIPITFTTSTTPDFHSTPPQIIVPEEEGNPPESSELERTTVVHPDQFDQDDWFSLSLAGRSRTRISRSEAPEGDLINKEVRDSRCFSAGQRPLRRVNAKRRPSNTNSLNTGSANFTNGSGVFTHTGGRLTNSGSGIEILIPEGAIAHGKSQKLWFDVVQTVVDPRELAGGNSDARCLGDSELFDAESGTTVGKRSRKVQLSPMVLVGPCDAVFQRPIKIKLPHCLPYRNNSWHLHMLARAQNSDNDDWTELSNTFGLIPPRKGRQASKFFQTASYQMHLDYAQVRTCQMGCFRLVGNPIRNGSHSAKRMIASVYVKGEGGEGGEGGEEAKTVPVLVFITNAILDHAKALSTSLVSNGYQCLERNIPLLCFGDGRDMELTLWSCDSNTATPLATKAILFGQFWRQRRVGQSHVRFEVARNLLQGSRTLALRMQQAGAKIFHETNFIVP